MSNINIIQQNIPRNAYSRWQSILDSRQNVNTKTNINKSKKNKRKIEIHSIDIIYRENSKLTENGLLGMTKKIRFGKSESNLIENIITNIIHKMNKDIAKLITEFSHPIPKPGTFYKKTHIMRAAKSSVSKSYSITKRRVKKHGICAFIHFLEPGNLISAHKEHTNISRFLDEIGSFGPIVSININLLSVLLSDKKPYLYKVINQKFNRYYTTTDESLVVNKTSYVSITKWTPIYDRYVDLDKIFE